MLTVLRRVVGALLTLAGIALTALGGWFAAQLGGEGTARFTTTPPAGTRVVQLDPEILNRVPSSVQISATTASGNQVWIGRANPSDAAAALTEGTAESVTGVHVRDWRLTTSTVGAGTAPTLGGADLWREQASGDDNVSLTIDQDHAPETVVIQGITADVTSVTAVWQRKTWFVEAVVAAIVGVFLAIAGVLLLLPRRSPTPVEVVA